MCLISTAFYATILFLEISQKRSGIWRTWRFWTWDTITLADHFHLISAIIFPWLPCNMNLSRCHFHQSLLLMRFYLVHLVIFYAVYLTITTSLVTCLLNSTSLRHFLNFRWMITSWLVLLWGHLIIADLWHGKQVHLCNPTSKSTTIIL